MLTTYWKSGGQERSWTSTLGEIDPDETLDELIARHKVELAKMQRALPPDPPPAD